MYHVGRWGVQVEILLQKLDHCGVALLSTGTMIPTCMLLLPPNIGLVFGVLSTACSLWTCYYIYVRGQPSVFRQVIVPCCLLPFLPWVFAVMNSLEVSLVLGTMLAQVIGLSVFLNEWPSPWPSVFGHHEVFHVFVTLAGVFVYVANLSIVRRSAGLDPLSFHYIYTFSADLLTTYANYGSY
jgi:hemolysin III